MNSLPLPKIALSVFAFVVLAALAGCGKDPAAQMTPPPQEVTVAQVVRGPLPLDLEYTGRTAGSREVELRARVSGILLQRLYEEGSAVRKGDHGA